MSDLFFLCTELTLFCTELTLFCTELPENCIYLNQSELSKFFTYIIKKDNLKIQSSFSWKQNRKCSAITQKFLIDN